MNGNSNNGQNGNGNGKSDELTQAGKNVATTTKNKSITPSLPTFSPPEQSVILKQSPIWSRTIIWTLMSVTTAALIWSALAKIEQVVGAQGQLKPQGKVQEVQAPVNGVVQEVKVKDGDRVNKGDVLVLMDSSASKVQLESLGKIRATAEKENQFYRLLMAQDLTPAQVESSIAQLKLPSEIADLARNRAALVAENQLYQAQVSEGASSSALQEEQLARLAAARRESNSRQAAARLEMEQLEKQLAQTGVQLADARSQLIKDRLVLEEIKTRNANSMKQGQESLDIERNILNDIEPLGEEGAVARYQINKQKQSVTDRQNELQQQEANGEIDREKQEKEVQTRIAEISRLEQEEKRYFLLISQAQEKLINTTVITEKDVRDKMADNHKRIAEIDSQISRIIIDNNKRIAELDSQISQAQQTIKYQKITAPIDGVVFDLKARPGFVPQPSQAEALLKIVPDGCPTEIKDAAKGCLVAEVDVTNQDIGFVRVGQKADIRIDSFSYSEYGDIKGEVISIGSDALPPDENHRFYRFPVRVSLNSQELVLKDKSTLPLQSGMSVSVNIKVNENRTVLGLFTDMFNKQVDTLKQVR
ncbi:hemolysin secretion protein D, plasmid [Microcystis aeruginosa NIES-2520]|uniref:Hemolysin secretion protein D, plasmid n=1 Tax=Microcystis aeruginosa NIES-2520 TaxID=2303982 RepID=A0A5A5RPP9_MICAE|nr:MULTISPECIES: HlyD family efflux transporter periplasmic adaptor subunit [Microcystis]MCA2668334.1 HlyD family efflux transporter periplasmic adaptor subunit [Microcystis sp. M045S2]MCA2712936.1 HlyD family efflux transporter periplasmic adaptor subunit [Microcystis sp. M172S2]MCA2803200.1 HlyD family efflux transporter periplasmic adaptor subunit [Microcystis sp. M114S2]MCA2832232.1 HlyD family efflux transporter periplasmic adaptor subunit [Microcystis sp. M007S1]MCA2838687.1 HlyD family 